MGHGALANKKATTALERIQRLENMVNQLFQAIGQTFGTIENRFQSVEEMLQATAGIVGSEQVNKAIIDARREVEAARAAAAKSAIAQMVESGGLVVADTVGAESLVVGIETTNEGKPIGYLDGRVQAFVAEMAPGVSEKMLGLKVGGEIETTRGGKFTITEIYNAVTDSNTPSDVEALVQETPETTPDPQPETTPETVEQA